MNGLIKIILIFAFVVCFVLFPFFRCVVCHPYSDIRFGGEDLFNYIRHKGWRNFYKDEGQLVAYCGLFGKGKTLSAVKHCVGLYDRYNGLKVYDKFRKKWVTQQVVILSNVHVARPYVECRSLKQITNFTKDLQAYDDDNDTITFCVCLLDELSVQMNSRNFKTNIDPLFLNTILTCRHYHLSIYYTAQRFNQVDALLRQVTQTVYQCNKIWRLQGLNAYDAYELENCTNPTLIKPIGRYCLFITNKDYNNYNTIACVENLEHSMEIGDMLSDSEILEKIAPQYVGADTVVNYSRKAKKRMPHKKKYS